MFKQPRFKKNQYLRVLYFTKDKQVKTYYLKNVSKELKLNEKAFLINPDHIFYSNKFKTIIVSSESAESINPLDFKSRFSPSMFNSAINNKLISDTFETLDKDKMDVFKLLLFGIAFINIIILFMLLRSQGVI